MQRIHLWLVRPILTCLSWSVASVTVEFCRLISTSTACWVSIWVHYYWPAYIYCRGASIVLLSGICRRLWSVVVFNTLWRCICNVTHQGAARDGGPVVLHPVRATPCYFCHIVFLINHANCNCFYNTLSRVCMFVQTVTDAFDVDICLLIHCDTVSLDTSNG